MNTLNDNKVLIGCILGSVAAYNGVLALRNFIKSRKTQEFIPVGVVKHLFIFPAKSCKGKNVFSFFCGPKGAIVGDMEDRHFQVIDGATGTFYTIRQKSQMVLIDVTVVDGVLTVTLPDGRHAEIEMERILEKRDVRPSYMFQRSRQDGLDCGDEISALLSEFLEEPDVRMIYYVSGLHNERLCVTQESWWNNPVPKRTDEVAFEDLSPYMIMTQASLDDLNTKLETKVTPIRFRPEIFIDRCAAWDEDKWDVLKIGDVEFQCYKPCDRCVLPTVDPETGKKDPGNQPLKTLREFRLAPEGKMRKEFKDSPLFGVNAGIIKPGFIHEGQVVYAKYKPSAF